MQPFSLGSYINFYHDGSLFHSAISITYRKTNLKQASCLTSMSSSFLSQLCHQRERFCLGPFGAAITKYPHPVISVGIVSVRQSYFVAQVCLEFST